MQLQADRPLTEKQRRHAGEIHHFICPKCLRLTSVPWEGCWCLHNDSVFVPHGPSEAALKDPFINWAEMLEIPHDAVVRCAQTLQDLRGIPDAKQHKVLSALGSGLFGMFGGFGTLTDKTFPG